MRSIRRRLGVLLVLAGISVALALVSVAFACGRLASLHLAPVNTKQGATVSGFGRNYTAAPTASPVELRFNSRTGPVLWSGRPNVNGEITPSFEVPNVKSGTYVVMALQATANGSPSPGTPGRAPLRIGKSKSRSHSGAAWAPAHANGGSGGGGLAPDTGLLGGLLAAALVAAGLGVMVGDRRRARLS